MSDVVTYVTRRGLQEDPAVVADRDADEGPPEEQSAQPRWPEDWAPPPCLTDVAVGPKAVGQLEGVLQATLNLLLRDDPNPRPQTVAEMDALCQRRPQRDVQAAWASWDRCTGRKEPKSKPQPKPRPKAIRTSSLFTRICLECMF